MPANDFGYSSFFLQACSQHKCLVACKDGEIFSCAFVKTTDAPAQDCKCTDDIYVVRQLYDQVEIALWEHARVRPNRYKTKAWNAAGEEPRGIRDLQSEGGDPVWVGDWGLPQDQQGLVALGTPLGTDAFVHIKRVAQDRLLERIPHVEDLQASWLFLRYCAAPRANYLLRVLPPALSGVRCRSRRNCRSKLGPASRLCGHPAAGRRRECSTARGAVWRSRPALCEGRPACGTLGILVRRWPGWASTPCTARQRAVDGSGTRPLPAMSARSGRLTCHPRPDRCCYRKLAHITRVPSTSCPRTRSSSSPVHNSECSCCVGCACPPASAEALPLPWPP